MRIQQPQSLWVLKWYEINLFQILSLIFKCKNRIAPFVFHNLYTLKPPSKYSLRTSNLLSIPFKKTKFNQFSIYFRGSYLWSKTLAQKTFICNVEYYLLFKNRLKNDYTVLLSHLRFSSFLLVKLIKKNPFLFLSIKHFLHKIFNGSQW